MGHQPTRLCSPAPIVGPLPMRCGGTPDRTARWDPGAGGRTLAQNARHIAGEQAVWRQEGWSRTIARNPDILNVQPPVARPRAVRTCPAAFQEHGARAEAKPGLSRRSRAHATRIECGAPIQLALVRSRGRAAHSRLGWRGGSSSGAGRRERGSPASSGAPVFVARGLAQEGMVCGGGFSRRLLFFLFLCCLCLLRCLFVKAGPRICARRMGERVIVEPPGSTSPCGGCPRERGRASWAARGSILLTWAPVGGHNSLRCEKHCNKNTGSPVPARTRFSRRVC